MQLKPNHYYLNRDGTVAGPMERSTSTHYPFFDPRTRFSHTDSGFYYAVEKAPHDLVKELGSAADGWIANTGKVPNIMGRVEAICRDGSTLTFPARIQVYWAISNLPSSILVYRHMQPEPQLKFKRVERLARVLLVRMKEINTNAIRDGGIPTCHDYSLLWDAILDEVKHACPDLNVDEGFSDV